MATPVDANYVRARSGLLDALAALGPLRKAAVLVGAQAVYEYIREQAEHFAVSPFTFDADVALVPELLVDDPKIIDAMGDAGFKLTDQPGIYKRDDGAQVDLLVPEAVGGEGRRGARLGVHGNLAARQVRGLEGALVSQRLITMTALADGDDRAYEINVAGPGALLVAKMHKLADRMATANERRLSNKDAFDVFRLLQAVDTIELMDEVNLLADDTVSAEVTNEAMAHFQKLFGTPTASGTVLVAEHVEGLEDHDTIVAASVALAQDLVDRVG